MSAPDLNGDRALSAKEALSLYLSYFPPGYSLSFDTWERWIKDGTIEAHQPGRGKSITIRASAVKALAERKAGRP